MESSRPDDRIALAVDLSYQCYRATAAHQGLTSGRHFTGGLYGFFVSVAKAVRETYATDLIICEDLKPYVRSKEYPEYKAGRSSKSDPEIKSMHLHSMVLIREVLGALGLPIWGLKGFESDDLIGYLATHHRSRYRHIYAMSNDSDLFQLLNYPNFSIYVKDIHSLWTAQRLKRELDLTPDQYMLSTALQGTHNAVEGIPKVGEVTSRKAARDPGVLRKYRDAHGALIDRNLRLIKLPHPDFPRRLEVVGSIKEPIKDREVYRIFGKYDIDVTDSMLKAIKQVKE